MPEIDGDRSANAIAAASWVRSSRIARSRVVASTFVLVPNVKRVGERRDAPGTGQIARLS